MPTALCKHMTITYETQFKQIIEHVKKELSHIRTSRATPELVENVPIEVYGGSKVRLNEVASISIPDPRTITITPWDKSIIKEIEKSLIKSDIDFNPIVDTDFLRIHLPALTGETREKLVKKIHHILEENRVKLRSIRDDAKKGIERNEKSGDLTKDDKFSEIQKLNESIREYTNTIDELGKKKEDEITTI